MLSPVEGLLEVYGDMVEVYKVNYVERFTICFMINEEINLSLFLALM